MSGGAVSIGHVGDSRAYRLRDGRLEQLTHDHSLVGDLVRSGLLSPEEARTHPQRSVITRALGTDPDVDADTFTVEPQPGDVYLLCSDGLTDMLEDSEIVRVVREASGLESAAKALVKAANRKGGEDNVTVVLFEMVEGEPTAEPAPAEVPDPEPDADQGPDTAEHLDPVLEDGGGPRDDEEPPSPRRFGAGPGGRLAALLVVVVILGIGALALYLALNR